ncbi:hypothetical protein K458DRAFT_119016 [Lentithecium fluviatile CBS 122367]|uniref:Uncharacterized protein n=1 Tax=Lentithecium fluviatile CBS 122367 TaxID=1168545 RepID=A0A6G1ILT1_9PLEO|nr:hypothetical protein K458DRAFT_119016 [Lentithecium fluviatile CBS 122367]
MAIEISMATWRLWTVSCQPRSPRRQASSATLMRLLRSLLACGEAKRSRGQRHIARTVDAFRPARVQRASLSLTSWATSASVAIDHLELYYYTAFHGTFHRCAASRPSLFRSFTVQLRPQT